MRGNTIPGPDHPDNRTWAGDSWPGGAATWITAYDGTGPHLLGHGQSRPGLRRSTDGNNLYSDSALAVHELGFQFTPWDVHVGRHFPILADLELNGETRKVMMWANRNAFYYTLDRETGEFLVGTPYADVGRRSR